MALTMISIDPCIAIGSTCIDGRRQEARRPKCRYNLVSLRIHTASHGVWVESKNFFARITCWQPVHSWEEAQRFFMHDFCACSTAACGIIHYSHWSTTSDLQQRDLV